MARAKAGRPARSTTPHGRSSFLGLGEAPKRQPVGPVDLASRVVADLVLAAAWRTRPERCRTRALFIIDRAWSGVVVTALRGAEVDGSGQSKASSK